MKTMKFLTAAFMLLFAVYVGAQTTTTDPGVEINGVIWATRNVDLPGTFTANPEDIGKFYQWNRNAAWSTEDPLTSSDGSTWSYTYNDNAIVWKNSPCPTGWRMPTMRELMLISNNTTVQWESNGYRIGTGDNTIFLPVSGYRNLTKYLVSEYGSMYWGLMNSGEVDAISLNLSNPDFNQTPPIRAASNPADFALPVRCVANLPDKLEDMYLRSIDYTQIPLSTTVHPDTLSYKVTVPYWEEQINLFASSSKDGRIAQEELGDKFLTVGDNTFTITVTSADSTMQTVYTLVVTREEKKEEIELNVSEPGTLYVFFQNAPSDYTVKKLKITGNIDVFDISALSVYDVFKQLVELDLSEANIVAFEDNDLFFPANTISDYSFVNLQNLHKITFPKTLTSIGNNVLMGENAITSIVIPEGVTSIGDNFVAENQTLTTVSLPSTLQSIAGTGCFMACSNLSTVICRNPEAPYANPKGSFYDVRNAVLFVPFGCKTAYENADVWKEFTNIVELPALTEITETPATDGATIEWQAYEHAEGYLLTIYSDELHTDTLHIFEFNAAGEFVGEISLRDADASHSHTISGLASGTQYYYTLETLGSGVALEKQTGSFTTLGGTTGIDDSLSKPAEAKKAIGYYSITGQQLSKDKEPESGLYIIKYDNGTAEKRMKK